MTVNALPSTGTVTVSAGKTLTVTAAQTVAALNNISGKNGAKLVLKVASSDQTSAASTKFYTAASTAVASGANIPAGTYVSNGTQWVKQ